MTSLFGLDPNASEWEEDGDELYPVEESTNVLVGTQTNANGRKLLVSGDAQIEGQVFGNTMLVGTTSNPSSRKLVVNGSAQVTGQLTLGSTITNGTHTFTLPSSTGTILTDDDNDWVASDDYVTPTDFGRVIRATGTFLSETFADSSYADSVVMQNTNQYTDFCQFKFQLKDSGDDGELKLMCQYESTSSDIFECNKNGNVTFDEKSDFAGGLTTDFIEAKNATANALASDSIKGWVMEAVLDRRMLALKSGSYYPWIGLDSSNNIAFLIHLNSIGDAYTINNSSNQLSGLEHDFRGHCMKMVANKAIFKHINGFTYFYNGAPQSGVANGSATYTGAYFGYHDNGSVLFHHLPYTGSANAYFSWSAKNNDYNNASLARLNSTGSMELSYGSLQLGQQAGSYTSTIHLNVVVNHALGSSNGSSFFTCLYNGTQIGDVGQSSTSSVQYNTTSDYRLKENVVPCGEMLSIIDAMQVHEYNFISDREAEIDQKYIGFIAHEVQELDQRFNVFVSGEKDQVSKFCTCCKSFYCQGGAQCTACNEEGECLNPAEDRPKYQQIDYGKMTPICIKGIQELHFIIQAQRAEIDALSQAAAALLERVTALENRDV